MTKESKIIRQFDWRICRTFLLLSFLVSVSHLKPMGVATYKTADEVEPELVKLLPPKEELMKIIDKD